MPTRLEATLPDPRGAQVVELANSLKVSRSAFVEEALSLLVMAIMEARHGRRVAIVDTASQRVVSQLTTPLLMQVEWGTQPREKIALTRREAKKVDELLANPPSPGPALRRAMSRRRNRG